MVGVQKICLSLFILLLTGCFSSNNLDIKIQEKCNQDTAKNYYGEYKIDHYAKTYFYIADEKGEKYISRNLVGQKYSFSKDLFTGFKKDNVKNPIYKIECIKLYKEEGNVQNKKYSYFSGFGQHREYIKLLKVYKTKEDIKKDTPNAIFELNNNELWIYNKGSHFIFVLTKEAITS